MLAKTLFALIIFLLTLFGGFYPFKKHRQDGHGYEFTSGESLACGVFLGAGLLHMLGESSASFHQQGYHYPFAFLLAGSIFLLFLWLEHLGREWYHHKGKESPYFALLAVVMMSVHSFLTGSALGLSADLSLATILFIAIISHKLAESFAIAVHLTKSGLTFPFLLICFAIFSLMTPLGIFWGSCLSSKAVGTNWLEPTFSALAAGTFLYLGTLHGLDKCVLVKQCCDLKYFSYVILGFSIMAVMAIYV